MILARSCSIILFVLLWYFWVLPDGHDVWGPSCVISKDFSDDKVRLFSLRRLGIVDDDPDDKEIVYYCSQIRGAMPYICSVILSVCFPLIFLRYSDEKQPENQAETIPWRWTAFWAAIGLVSGLVSQSAITSNIEYFLFCLPGTFSIIYMTIFAIASLSLGHIDLILSLMLACVFAFTGKSRFFAIFPLCLTFGLHLAEYISKSTGEDEFDPMSRSASLVLFSSLGALWMIHERTSNKFRPWIKRMASFYTFYWVWPSLHGPGVTYEQLPQLDEKEDPTRLSNDFLDKQPMIKTPFQLLKLCCYSIQKQTFWTSMLHGWFYLFCMTLDPILLHQLLSSERSNARKDIMLGVGLSLSMLLRVSCMEVCFFYSVRTMAAARSALVVAIFKRTLEKQSKSQKVKVDLPNLMSGDADKVGASGWVIFFLASWTFALMSLPIYLFILTQYVGFGASLAGLSVLLVGGLFTRQIASCAQPLFKRLQEARDQRSFILRSALGSMLSIKMFADEPRWITMLKQYRNNEMSIWMKVRYVSAFNGLFTSLATMSVPIIVFAWVTQVEQKQLDPAAAFTTLLVISQISWSIGTLPDIFNLWSSLSPSAGRLLGFFQEYSPSVVQEEDALLEKRGGSISSLDEEDRFKAIQIATGTVIGFTRPLIYFPNDLIINRGDFVVVIGEVGSGKSCLLEVLSGANAPLAGCVQVSSHRAFTEQKPFLLNGTVKDNVLFGENLDETRLKSALKDAMLERDLAALPRNVETLVGDSGVQLSGGQRARVALARALYTRGQTELFVFDDLLASVDGHTGRAIWNDTILPLLDDLEATLVMSSSFPSKEMLARCTVRITLERGGGITVRRNDLPVSIKQEDVGHDDQHLQQPNSPSPLNDADAQQNNNNTSQEMMIYPNSQSPSAAHHSPESSLLNNNCEVDEDRENEEGTTANATQQTEDTMECVTLNEVERELEKTLKARLGKTLTDGLVREVTDEMVGRTDDDARDASDQAEIGGTISSLDLWEYWSRFGLQFMKTTLPSKLAIVGFILIGSVLEILSPYWLAHWTESESDGLVPYVLIQVGQVVLAQLGFMLLSYCALGASTRLHSTALKHLLMSPMSLFDSVPAGRLLNIFSGDLRAIDESLPDNGYQQLKRTLVAIMQVIVIAFYAQTVLLVVPPLFFIYRFILGKVRGPSRDVKRIEAASNVPVYVGYLDALRGRTTIRAFHREEAFLRMHSTKARRMATARVANEAIGKWAQALAVQTGCLLYFCCAMAGISALYNSNDDKSFSVAKLALLLTFAGILQRTGMDLMMGWTSFEASLVSIERMSSVLRLPFEEEEEDQHVQSARKRSITTTQEDVEAPLLLANSSSAMELKAPLAVEFRSVRMRYRLYRPLVLRSATFRLPGGAKAAIVGRSGGGKSSLFLAMLRVYPTSSGEILFGNINIKDVPLSKLRRNGDVRVVLQDALLPHPTLRANVDPQMGDSEMRNVLQRVGLTSDRFQLNLDLEVGQGGSQLSVGERQLVCLARALSGTPKLLLCDECTSSVDEQVDELVHDQILGLKDVTVCAILHRTVHLRRFDYLIVVDKGRVVRIEKNN